MGAKHDPPVGLEVEALRVHLSIEPLHVDDRQAASGQVFPPMHEGVRLARMGLQLLVRGLEEALA